MLHLRIAQPLTPQENPPMNRRALLLVSLCVAWFFSSALPSLTRAAKRRPPNVVLIVSDDQGYHDLGCYGNQTIKTPHLDRLASQGVRLTDFYVAWPACTPSRGALLTGRYPQRNGLYDMIRNDLVNYDYQYDEVTYALSNEMILGLDLREITVAQVLKTAGYTSGVFGKWDSGRARRFLPLQRGFNDFYGFANTGIDYWTHERYGVPSMFRGNDRVKEKGYATDLFRREAVRFIRENKDRPFFLYVPFNAPHGASNLQRPGAQAPESYIKTYADAGHDAKSKKTVYMACVTAMDDAIGEILDLLKKLDLERDTLVIFFSDNGGGGGADNSPLRGRKAQMFEGGNRVPCLVRWPGVIPVGTVCREFLSAMEILPTLAAVTGAKLPKGVILDGFDMLPVIKGESPSKRKEMFWERRTDKAARVGNYKWVDSERGGGLFDLSKDIGEQHDLSKEKPKVLAQVKARFAAWKKAMQEAEPRGPFRNY